MSQGKRVEELLARYVEHLLAHGAKLDPAQLCADEPELVEPLEACIRQYEQLERTLDPGEPRPATAPGGDARLPRFEGFHTIERLGGGGAGEVYKLEDLELGRCVAAKVVRPDNPLRSGLDDFLREARSLALFEDSRIVRLHEFRSDADPPVLLMEYVDGFTLGRVGPSLEPSQQARVMAELCDAVHRAHSLGLQHRDLKPDNVILDDKLQPKILDFGLSRGEPDLGHGVGTPTYMAPEQLRPGRPIDARTDVYALGVMLYELLCGEPPYAGKTVDDLLWAVEQGKPRLPVEVESGAPEPLQAIALKAMERNPADRYESTREMALELRRYLDGRPVLARPTLYQSTLERRLRPHLEQIREWLRLKLIYPHEAERLSDAYERLRAREDDWIVESRVLSLSQIALYLGAFLLVCGSLLYFLAYFNDAIQGLVSPVLVLGLPFVGLNVAAHLLYGKQKRAVAVAFYLGAILLLPLFLLILLQEAAVWVPDPENALELFGGATPSNRQLQLAGLAACAWSLWLALGTRTVALSSCFTAMAGLVYLAVLTDFGLRRWLEEGRWDLLALHLFPLVAAAALAGRLAESRGRSWFARPLYFAGVGLFVLVLELLALNGEAFGYLGLSVSSLQSAGVSDPALLDTVAAMTLNGLLFYGAAWLLDRHGSVLVRSAARLLFSLSPFAILQPLSWLSKVGEYSRHYDWIYLALALLITVSSRLRQRKSFYYAGLLNTGVALWLITDHHDWFDRPAWAAVVVFVGLLVLAVGFGLHARERTRRARDIPES